MSYFRKLKLSRRAMLQGIGTAIALPSLEIMGTSAHAATTPQRFLGYYVPCGINMEKWSPNATGYGSQWALSDTLSPLESLKSKINVLSGLNNRPAIRPGGDHAAGTAAFMTARSINNSQTDLRNGKSADQYIADQIGGNTKFKSLQLGIESPSICDSTYACAYSRSISWASSTQPLPKTVNPRTVFNQLFAGVDRDESTTEQARRLARNQSVLDAVLNQANSLHARLGQSDRAKLDEYLNGIRELEQRINLENAVAGCTTYPEPDDNLDVQTAVDTMTDLMVIAFQCGYTNVISFMLGDGLSNRSHDFLGVSGSHHELSHHQSNATKLAGLATIDQWEVAQFANLLTKLDAIQDGTGTLLDSTLLYFSSEISDGDSHSHDNMPIVLAGSGGTVLTTDRHIDFGGQQVANMLHALMGQYGVSMNSFGDDGSGQLSGLFV